MHPDLAASLAPLAVFVFVASITPGPNNIMLAAAGAHSGFRATIPHLLGICSGLMAQIALCALGVGALLLASPALSWLLRVGGAGYLLVLAYRLVRPAAPGRGSASAASAPADAGAPPLGFVGAAAFQFVNPKAWMIALTAGASLLPRQAGLAAAIGLGCLVATLVNLPCVSCWALLGAGMRRRLREPWIRRLFNGSMAAALAGTAAWILLTE